MTCLWHDLPVLLPSALGYYTATASPHSPTHLLAPNAGGGGHVHKHSGLQVAPRRQARRAAAARQQARAVGGPRLDVGQNLGVLRLRHHGAQPAVGLQRVADLWVCWEGKE